MKTINLKFSDCFTPEFRRLHEKISKKQANEIWLKGGRGSLKSSFAAIQVILNLLKDANANALVVRAVHGTIKNSVHSTLCWAINFLGLSEFFKVKVSPPEIIFLPTGQKIIMSGLDDPAKLKSIKVEKGYFKILWIEEVDECKNEYFIRNLKQSVLRGGEEFLEFYSFNPPKNEKHWCNVLCGEIVEDPRRIVHSSTYLDVPEKWLGKRFFQLADRLKKNNYEAYKHEYLGIPCGNPEELVFFGKYRVESHELLETLKFERLLFGMDFGFAADPFSLIKASILEDKLYILEEKYFYHLEYEDMVKVSNSMEGAKSNLIYADSARPDTISYLSKKGFLIRGAEKKKGSVEDGISYMKSFKEIIISDKCPKTLEEFNNYSYKVDKVTKEVLPILEDNFNHSIDAIRYALSKYITHEADYYDIML